MNDCCILVMSAPRTLKVVDSLSAAGFAVWAPRAMRRMRRPRSDKFRDVERAVMPGFAFAPVEHLSALLSIEHAPGSDHPPFHVLKNKDTVQAVAAKALDPLREYEAQCVVDWHDFVKREEEIAREKVRRRKSRKRGRANPRRAYVIGQRVRVLDPAFEGLGAEVVRDLGKNRLTIVVDGRMELTLDTCDLAPSQLQGQLPEQRRAA